MDQDFEIRKLAISIVVQHMGGKDLTADTLVSEAKKVENFLRGQHANG